jgi:hypothetical protein
MDLLKDLKQVLDRGFCEIARGFVAGAHEGHLILSMLGGHPKPATDGRLKTGHHE